ncbi:hypothetical protein SEPCBS119000_004281 [Sporothrix epigloea]|uniref:JmjC domain-containing protein n=1 Tax=Sporothrix epigloea TaxID=1892477 RepID=A0ABP0DU71_9PEZI
MTSLYAALWSHCLYAARLIADDHSTNAGLEGCGTPLVDLLRRQATQILQFSSDRNEETDTATEPKPNPETDAHTWRVSRRLQDLIELAYARFYAYPPSDVPACWRHLYTDASIMLFSLRWWQRRGRHTPLSDDDLDQLVRPLDLSLILAGGIGLAGRGPDWIHAAFDMLHRILEEDGKDVGECEDERRRAKRPRLGSSVIPKDGPAVPDFSAGPFFSTERTASSSEPAWTPPVRHPVPRSGPLGLEAFQAYLDGRGAGAASRRGPLVLSGMLDHWPACQPQSRPWSSPGYLRWRTLRGRRLVPVEVGRSYVDDGWTQAIVPFADVLAELSCADGRQSKKSKKTGGPTYLAQHALFSQMPRLQSDISIPDACYTSTQRGDKNSGDDDDDDYDNDCNVLMNAWLGPPGTITPLHTDPHHNLLAQVVGRKYVRLYAPEQTAALRPRGREAGDVDMGNTSTVDVGAMEGWDAHEQDHDPCLEDSDEITVFRAVPYVDCILEPGDTLYIPQGWWHYVRGLSVSFSVSFWWN